MLPIGKDTLLRAVRRRWVPGAMASAVIGINEWAWRRRRNRRLIPIQLSA
ncbi:hypothetical protein ACFQU7_29845 [Pseudoroseomonas wenyumeiae]